jgi:translation initiation factor 2 beta subunit (eIF-2beta)/eIF-5
MVTVDYFLFTWMKTELLVISVAQESSKKTWDGVARTVAKEDFTAAFRRWQELYKKCDRIGNVDVKKQHEIKFSLK